MSRPGNHACDTGAGGAIGRRDRNVFDGPGELEVEAGDFVRQSAAGGDLDYLFLRALGPINAFRAVGQQGCIAIQGRVTTRVKVRAEGAGSRIAVVTFITTGFRRM